MEIFNETTLPNILRGLYAAPIICELSKLGIFTKASRKINLKNKEKIKNKFVLNISLNYLSHIGLLSKNIKPRKSAPREAATLASSEFVRPHILTLVI